MLIYMNFNEGTTPNAVAVSAVDCGQMKWQIMNSFSCSKNKNCTMSSKPKKRKCFYSTHVPRNRGRAAVPISAEQTFNAAGNQNCGVSELDEVTVCAIISAWRLCANKTCHRGSDVLTVKDFTARKKPTQSNLKTQARLALADWLVKKTIPDDAVLYLIRNYIQMWDKLPALRDLMLSVLRRNSVLRSVAFKFVVEELSHVWPTLPSLRSVVLEWIGEEHSREPSSPEQPTSIPRICDNEESTHDDESAETLIVNFEGDQYVVPRDLYQVDNDQWSDFYTETYQFRPPELISEAHNKLLRDVLDDTTVAFLIGSNRRKAKVSFMRILQHWAVTCNITQEKITKLLKLLHKHKITLHFGELPQTAKTLLVLKPGDMGGSSIIRVTSTTRSSTGVIRPPSDVDVSCGTASTMSSRHRQHASKETTGEYLHYGVMTAIKGTSPGMYKYVNIVDYNRSLLLECCRLFISNFTLVITYIFLAFGFLK